MESSKVEDLPTVEQEISNIKKINSTLLLCINMLYENSDTENAIHNLLQIIAEYHNADRAYIFELDESQTFVSNTYEWCNEKIEPLKNKLQQLPVKKITYWKKLFEEKGEVQIFSVKDELTKNLDEYQRLTYYGITSIFAVPFYEQAGLVGFLGVDNPKENKDTTVLLKSVATFALYDIRRRKYMKKLYELSYSDRLTGLLNRHAYVEEVKKLETCTTELGIIFTDINGLKFTNDNFGHEKGDELILNTANTLKSIFGKNKDSTIYRIGGDEFVVFCKNQDAKQFLKKVEELKVAQRRIKTDCNMNLSIGSVWLSEEVKADRKIEKAVSRADKLMYEDKKRFYKSTCAQKLLDSQDHA